MATKSHFKQLAGQLEQTPGVFFTVKLVTQVKEKALFVGEHVRALGSVQTTQFYPFSKAKPGKQLLQIELLPVEQALHEDMHLTGTPLTKE